MMKAVAVAALAFAIAAPAIAHEAHGAAPAAPAAAAKLTIDTPIETIAADANGKAVLEAQFPGITAHPMYDSFKAMSLKQVQPMSGGVVTDDKVAKVAEGLAALK